MLRVLPAVGRLVGCRRAKPLPVLRRYRLDSPSEGGAVMGLFDRVAVSRPEFQCSEGHDLTGAEFQTKDLGETMGYAEIDDRITIRDGGWGDTQQSPFSGTIEIYTDCEMCPAFVQDTTFNLHPTCVEFTVEIERDVVRKITRTSKTTAEQIAEAPTLDYMPSCRGPMSHEDARKRHMDRKFFPWDPVPTVDDATKERQRVWSERVASYRTKVAK